MPIGNDFHTGIGLAIAYIFSNYQLLLQNMEEIEIPNDSDARFVNMTGVSQISEFSEKSMTEQRYGFTKTTNNQIDPIRSEVSFQSQNPISLPSVIYYSDTQKFKSPRLPSSTRLPKQKHISLLILNILLHILLIAAVVLVLRYKIQQISLLIIVAVVCIYLTIVFKNPFRDYLRKTKQFNQIKAMNNEFRNRAGHIKFQAVCYNFVGFPVHKAIEIIPVYQCLDEGKELTIQPENNIFSLCDIKQYFTFSDPESVDIFQKKFEAFKDNNTLGSRQTFFHTLHIKISGFNSKIGVSKSGTDNHATLLYCIFTFLGFLYPISFMIEKVSARYEINWVKKFKL